MLELRANFRLYSSFNKMNRFPKLKPFCTCELESRLIDFRLSLGALCNLLISAYCKSRSYSRNTFFLAILYYTFLLKLIPPSKLSLFNLGLELSPFALWMFSAMLSKRELCSELQWKFFVVTDFSKLRCERCSIVVLQQRANANHVESAYYGRDWWWLLPLVCHR